MKKILAIVLLVMLTAVVCLCGCGDNKPDPENEPQDNPTVIEATVTDKIWEGSD